MSDAQHGGSPELAARALGLDQCPPVTMDFSVNLNPLGMPAAIRHVLMQGERCLEHYPDEYALPACRALAAAHSLAPEQVVVGNGSTEIFGWLLAAMRPRVAGWIAPCYGGYAEACAAHGIPMAELARLEQRDNFTFSADCSIPETVDLVFIGTPNNPTGRLVPKETIDKLSRRYPDVTFVLDVSFIDFAQEVCTSPDAIATQRPNVVVVKSLTKFFCIPGLRLGIAWGDQTAMERIKRARLPWTVNGLAQATAPLLYADADYIERSCAETIRLRDRFAERLNELAGFTVFPSDANFLLVRPPPEWPAPRLQKALLQQGTLVRSCESFVGLGADYCRLAVRPLEEQDRLIEQLTEICEGKTFGRVKERVTPPAVMVAGTTSNAGKSIVAAGLCRLIARRGVCVAPFKAQNMALNSYVTEEGGEMGRAQVTQAAAAGVRPHTDMNPVLLKPLGENGSQVIVNGQPIGNFKAREYYAMKARMRQEAHSAYDRLAARHDYLVLEGAGSPAEINLAAEDFVNMDMANYANARTILVADIDRGGVFATILGTIALMPEVHRRLLVGVVINKFRGDVSLLDSGIRDIESMTGVPVLGVLPYLGDLQIEDEDSLGLERVRDRSDAVLHVVVVRLPRISNFTDYLALECDQGIAVSYAEAGEDLSHADLVILPGTKNTRGDLQWLHDSGIAAAVHQARERGTPIFGVCGGYQMLGQAVIDDSGLEGSAGTTPGLGMLNTVTRLTPRKELSQVRGLTTDVLHFASEGTPFQGYEIHFGETEQTGKHRAPLMITGRHSQDVCEHAGAISDDGLVFGCYIHGLLDHAILRRSVWDWLCDRQGIPHEAVRVAERNASSEFDRLADLIESHIDLGFLDGLAAFQGS